MQALSRPKKMFLRNARGILSAVALSVVPLTSHAIAIGFNGPSAPVTVGSSFTVDVVVSGLTAAGESVSAFDLFFDFDNTLLTPTSVVLGPGATDTLIADTFFQLGNGFSLGTSYLGATGLSLPGPLSISALSLTPGSVLAAVQGDSVLLGSLSFTALAAGSTALSFANHPYLGILADVKGVDPFNPLSFASIGSALITVQSVSVPEPQTLGLLAFGLLLLPLRWRRRRTAA